MRLRTVAPLVLGLAILAACGTDQGGGTTAPPNEPDVTSTTSSGQEGPATTAPPEATDTTVAESMDGVHVAETDLGSILVDPEGFTLYVFTNDSQGESTCYEGCAELWPPVPADTAIGSDLDGSMFGSVTRDGGGEQLAINGMPLYLYTPDTNPGDTNGQGFGGVWFVVDPDGSMIEASATDTSGAQDRGSYDYDY